MISLPIVADDNHERFKRREHTPPPRVAKQLAPPEWEGLTTDAGQTPVRGVPIKADESSEQRLQRHVAETKNLTARTKHITEHVHSDVSALAGRVGELEGDVKTIKVAVDLQGKQNETIIGMTRDLFSMLRDRETTKTTIEREQTETTTLRLRTQNELDAEHARAMLDDKKERLALDRSWKKTFQERFAVPLLVAVTGLLVAALAALTGRL